MNKALKWALSLVALVAVSAGAGPAYTIRFDSQQPDTEINLKIAQLSYQTLKVYSYTDGVLNTLTTNDHVVLGYGTNWDFSASMHLISGTAVTNLNYYLINLAPSNVPAAGAYLFQVMQTNSVSHEFNVLGAGVLTVQRSPISGGSTYLNLQNIVNWGAVVNLESGPWLTITSTNWIALTNEVAQLTGASTNGLASLVYVDNATGALMTAVVNKGYLTLEADTNALTQLSAHRNSTTNPHQVTATQIGALTSVTNHYQPLSTITDAGSIASRASNDFYLASNPSVYISTETDPVITNTAMTDAINLRQIGDSVGANYNIRVADAGAGYGTGTNISWGGNRLLLNGWYLDSVSADNAIMSYSIMTNHTIGFLPLAGGTMTSLAVLDMNDGIITNVNNLCTTNSVDAKYFDAHDSAGSQLRSVNGTTALTFGVGGGGAVMFGDGQTWAGLVNANGSNLTNANTISATNISANVLYAGSRPITTNSTGIYIADEVTSGQDYLAMSPSSRDLVTAEWVRSLAVQGQELFFTTTLTNFEFGAKTTNSVLLSTVNQATSFTNTIASPVASGVYLAGGITTQLFGTVRSPITFEMYLNRVGGNASTIIPVHPEIYYILDGQTNHLGDWEVANQNVTATAPTRYTFTVAFPEPSITSGVRIVGYLKIGTVSGTAAGLAIVGGGIYPSRVDIEGVSQTDVDKVYNMATMTNWAGSVVDGNLNGGGNQSTNWSVVSANSIVLNGVTLNTNLQAISNVQRSNDVLVASSTNTLAWTNIPTMAGFNLTFSTSNHPFGMGILNGTQGMYFVTYSNATVYTNWNLGR